VIQKQGKTKRDIRAIPEPEKQWFLIEKKSIEKTVREIHQKF
jgi:hypothetical protein